MLLSDSSYPSLSLWLTNLRSGYIKPFCKLGIQVYFNFLLKLKTGNGLSFSSILGNAKMTDLKIILYLDGMLEDLSDAV